MSRSTLLSIALVYILAFSCKNPQNPTPQTEKTAAEYSDLVALFKEWRTFENPPLLDGAPDYRKATFEKRIPEFKRLQGHLMEMDTACWSIAEQVDYRIVWAEMNGYDFNHRILKPWERDPAYYTSIWTERSDVPAHEGPTHHGILELWQYNFPLDQASREKFKNELEAIPSLNTQAESNLSGNAKELWAAGIPSIAQQISALQNLLTLPGIADDAELVKLISDAKKSTEELVAWLEKEAPSKTGESGIGKENYTWYLQNVHLVPLTWEDEVMILKS